MAFILKDYKYLLRPWFYRIVFRKICRAIRHPKDYLRYKRAVKNLKKSESHYWELVKEDHFVKPGFTAKEMMEFSYIGSISAPIIVTSTPTIEASYAVWADYYEDRIKNRERETFKLTSKLVRKRTAKLKGLRKDD